jgi:hypothetical protein
MYGGMNAVPSTARRLRRLLFAATLCAGVLSQPATAAPVRLPEAPNCPVFPANSHWNLPVTKLPVLNGSKRIVRGIGAREHLHNNFGGGIWKGSPDGMPITVVGADQRKVPVRFVEHQWSDPGPYPIPPHAGIEYFGDPHADHHVILVDRDSCRLYETYDSKRVGGGRAWRAYAGATWNLRSNRLRPDGWTSADGAGLAMLPGLVRYEEVARGRINHAIRFAVPATRKGWIYPARHDVTDRNDPNLPHMGQRLRLKKSFNIKPFPRQSRIVLKAMKKYGIIVADEGGPWFYSGEPDRRWSYDDLHSLHRVQGKNFEVVDTSRLPRPGE